ncbi:MAG: sensor histidine kinase, partial [bacterium]
AGRERDTSEVVDVSLAARESLVAVNAPEGLELREEIEPNLVARGDPVLLGQVLIGLLSNAVKNTDPPGVVTIRALRVIGEEVRLEVEDTGKGIPAEDQPRVFERFYRSESARGVEGFGLGLAIAKRMVDLMGGEIGLRSEPGKGTMFWVRLRASERASTPVA